MREVTNGHFFFATKVKAHMLTNCRHAGHVPWMYREPAIMRWVTKWNSDQLRQRIPPKWICTELKIEQWLAQTRDDVIEQWLATTRIWKSQNMVSIPSDFCIKDTIPTKKVTGLLKGCSLLATGGKNYAYVTCPEEDHKSRASTALEPLDLCSLKDIYISTLLEDQNFTEFQHSRPPYWAVDWHSTYSKIPSTLTDHLKMEIQKRACPWKQIALGCFKAVRTWHPNGQLCQEIPLNAQGQYHGEAMMWDQLGRKLVSIHFKGGEMHGLCTAWNPNEKGGGEGLPVSVTQFEEGVPTGQRSRYEMFYTDKEGGSYERRLVEVEVFEPGNCSHRIRSTVTFPGRKQEERGSVWKLYAHRTEECPWKSITCPNGPEVRNTMDEDLYRVCDDSQYLLFYCACEIERLNADFDCPCGIKYSKTEVAARKEKEKGPPRKKQKIQD